MTIKDNPGVLVFGDSDDKHIVGDEECCVGWCGNSQGYPKRCVCGGLIHANFGDENWDDYWLYEMCDRCGEDYEEAE